MSFLAYTAGLLILAGSVALIGSAAARLIAELLPDWRGALRMLATIALSLSWIYAISYLTGTVGAFHPVVLLVILDGGAVAVWLRDRKKTPRPGGTGESEDPDNPDQQAGTRRRWAPMTLAAAAGAALTAISWLPATAHAYRYGILEPDSTWYHGHAVGRFLQTGWLTRIEPVGTDALVPFHPLNREVLDTLLVMPWHRDLVLPLLSLAGLALLLLAGWCVGARWNRAPAGLLAMALIASPATIRISQPGSLKNDLLAAAFLVAGIALALHSERRLPAVALAGAMLGLAAGTRTNLLLPMLIVVIAGLATFLRQPRPAARVTTERSPWAVAATWLGAVALFGSFWYLRNWLRVGNPLPWSDISLGPFQLSQVGIEGEDYFTQTILHWRNHPELISSAIRPGLRLAFGDLWWAWGLLGAAAAGLALIRGSLWQRALAVAGCLGLVAHLATPLSLVVEPGSPLASSNIAVNMRYALPAFGLVLLAGAGATPRGWPVRAFNLAALVLIVATMPSTRLFLVSNHDAEAADLPAVLGLGAGLALVTLAVLLVRGSWPWPTWSWWQRWQARPTSQRMALTAIPLLAGTLLMFPLASSYLDQRYATPVPVHGGELWPTVRDLHDARIGMASTSVPYPYLGTDLSNEVTYVGIRRPNGLLRNATSCAEWVQAVRSGGYTHLALTTDPAEGLTAATAREWTLTIPGTRTLHTHDDATLILLPRELPPPEATCAS